ncbi:hypothetical protein [Mesorhizobium sp. M8A.F.Ca.ET.021.01.1.1]|uniref:hypothetical protein n=1 Tax=Mesorhizobium sp. M8A.F.Ca.ET.021.01.1.1 TaxID=2496757 RepID=UPI000FCC322B|nr:hypothetical protein [Mesorhizobium sp. M8A.F.Ca.ET.021.01.1.1]RUW57169.1 hypothetical protein EOA36_00875 [Mesorhizobium sp. M8A.F.Ca.ET.021.01.1.1]
MAFEFEYLGFKVMFGENEEVWRCHALNVEHKSMGKVKGLIAAKLREEIKLANLVYGIKQWGKVYKVTVVGMVDGKPGRVWIKKDESDRRSQESMSDLFEWNDDAERLMLEADRLENEGNALIRKASAIRKEIKGLSEETLAAIIGKIKEAVQE